MTLLLAGIVLVAAIAVPYLVAAVLNVVFPGLLRHVEQFPRTDEVVARFFDRTSLSARSTFEDGAARCVPLEDRPSWSSAAAVSGRTRQGETFRR